MEKNLKLLFNDKQKDQLTPLALIINLMPSIYTCLYYV